MNNSRYFYISAFVLSFVPFGFQIAGCVALAMFLVVTFLDNQLGKKATREDKITLVRLESSLFSLMVAIVIIFIGWPGETLAPVGIFITIMTVQIVIQIPIRTILLLIRLVKVKR